MQAEIKGSRPVKNENDMSLQTTDSDEISTTDVVKFLREHAAILIAAPLVAGILGFSGSFLITPQFTASAQILQPQQQNSTAALLGSLGGLAGALGSGGVPGLKNPADQWIGFLKSNNISDSLISRFKLHERYDTKLQLETRKELSKRSRFSSGKDGFIDIEVDDEDPVVAAEIANAYIEELQRLSNEIAVTEASQRRMFFERELVATKQKLTASELALKASTVDAGLLKINPGIPAEALADITKQIAAQQLKISSLRSTFTEDSPELKREMQLLASLRQRLAESVKGDPSSTSNSDYIERFREYKYSEALYEILLRQYELARADEARQGALIQAVDKATPPELKSKPRRAVIAVMTWVVATALTLTVLAIRRRLINQKKSAV